MSMQEMQCCEWCVGLNFAKESGAVLSEAVFGKWPQSTPLKVISV